MKTRILLLFIAISALLTGCTHNGGDIGPLFGAWRLDSASRDNATITLPVGKYTTWAFQNSLLTVQLIDAAHYAETRIGSFSRTAENKLRLDFDNSADGIEAGTGAYAAPQWMGFPDKGVFDLDIAQLDGKKMVLVWQSPDGSVYEYKFTKTW
ncbi:MAG: lipocalin-like domain-containing protein [Muribaculaceae bacterium]|nr:lipocalin-like domain-containing protein [Muribaculaceae bacterium]